MKKLTIATFISNNEKESENFNNLVNLLREDYDLEVFIFSDFEIKDRGMINFIHSPHMTKYNRIKILLERSKNSNILCIDNDIIVDAKKLKKFIGESINVDYSIAWGKIKAQKVTTFTANLIKIDKNLSHNYIRPLLWNLNIGISLPGQVFMINKSYFSGKLPDTDTVYDDLAIGVIARTNKFPVYFTKDVLGFEYPKTSIVKLIKQRKRWARGLAETMWINIFNHSKGLSFILIHGFMFNLLWLPVYILILLISIRSLLAGVVLTGCLLMLIINFKLKDIVWGIAYMTVFPFIYTIWLFWLIFYLIKIGFGVHGYTYKKIV